MNAYVSKKEICINCGDYLFETSDLLSKMEGHTIWSHLSDMKCADPYTREEEQRELRKEMQTNPQVVPCIGCGNLTKAYSDNYPWCCMCETHKDISAYNWLTRADNSDRF